MFAAALTGLALAAGSCKPEEKIEPPVIKAGNITVTADSHTDKLTYTIENPVEGQSISARTDAEWIHTFNYETEGEIQFNVSANPGDERSALMTLSYLNAPDVTVEITQMAAGESISIEPASLAYAPAGGALTVTVTSDRDWTLSGGAGWIKASVTEGSSGDEVIFTAEENTTDDPREATFEFQCASTKLTLKATQSFTGRILVEKDTYALTGEAQSVTVNLQANTEVTFEIEDGCDWIAAAETKGMTDKSFTFTVTENEGDADRSAVITFKNEDAAEQVTFTQEPSFPADVLTKIEDETFKQYLSEEFDTDGSGKLEKAEVMAVTKMDLSYLGVASLAGIEYFANLEDLGADGNKLTTLDLTANKALKRLYIPSNSTLETLNISGCTALEEINIGLCSKVSAVDLTGMTELRNFIAYNSPLTSLNLADCGKLESLTVNGSKLESLDVSACPELYKLSAGIATLKSIDLTKNPKLIELSLSGANQLTALDLSANDLLENIDVSSCAFETLDHSNCSNLREITYSYNNNLTSINVSKNLKLNTLYAMQCFNLTEVIMHEGQNIASTWGISEDMIKYVPLEYPEDAAADIADAKLKQYILDNYDADKDGKINATEAQSVSVISLPGQGIASFAGMDWFWNIAEIDLSGNELTEIELTFCEKLEHLNLRENKLTAIDCERLTAVISLDLSHNELVTVDNFSDMKSLETADLSFNKMTSFKGDYTSNLLWLNISNNLLTDCSVHMNDKMADFDCSNNQLTSLNLWSLSGLVNFNCSNNPITDLGHTTYFKILETMNCSKTEIKTLNMSQNPLLRQLIATECPNLTEIYVGDNTISDLQTDEGVKIINGVPES